MLPVPPVDLTALQTLHLQMMAKGIPYGYGAKAEGGRNPDTGEVYNRDSTGHLSTPVETIDHIDCSGDSRYLLFHATNGALVLPDGSQAQRGWCEERAAAGLLHKVDNYLDLGEHTTAKRLFICFIAPGHHGCGSVGHVWLVCLFHGRVLTIESHGGQTHNGCDSRPYDTGVLKREVYSCYELPTVQGS